MADELTYDEKIVVEQTFGNYKKLVSVRENFVLLIKQHNALDQAVIAGTTDQVKLDAMAVKTAEFLAYVKTKLGI